jgi:hypothetical protein
MTLVFWNILQFSENLGEIVGCGIWHFIFEIEVDAFSGRNGDGVLALILLYELPEGISAELFLETYSHDFIFANLGPLDAVCVEKGVL